MEATLSREHVCVVTGGTAGIGRATATALARRGATVLIVGRDRERGRAAAEEIRRAAGHARVEFHPADLSSQAAVRTLAAQIVARHPRLHLLVNNAGALFATRRESVDGVEMTLATNHLGAFSLTGALLDALRAGALSRIVNVSSEAHRDVAAFDFDDPQAAHGTIGRYPRSEFASARWALTLPMAHPGFRQYARSKLANLLFTAQLARRLAGSGVSVHAVHPGVVASGFGGGNGLYGWFLRRQFQTRGIDCASAARHVVHVATTPDLAGYSGTYFVGDRMEAPSDAALDLLAAERLWRWSERMTARSD